MAGNKSDVSPLHGGWQVRRISWDATWGQHRDEDEDDTELEPMPPSREGMRSLERCSSLLLLPALLPRQRQWSKEPRVQVHTTS
jgi:hypothetical protein